MHIYSQLLLSGAAQMKSKWRPVKKGDEMMTTVIRTSFISPVSRCRNGPHAGGTADNLESELAFTGFIPLYDVTSQSECHPPYLYYNCNLAGFITKTGSDMNCFLFWAAGDLIKEILNGRIQKMPSSLTRIIKQGLPYIIGSVNESPSKRTSSERKTQW